VSKKLVLVGAGEFAKIAFEYFSHDSDYDVSAFSVESKYLTADTINGIPVVPYETLITEFPPQQYDAFAAVPATDLNRLRRRFYFDLKSKGYRLATYVSSRAFVWRNASIGENTFIFEANVIQPFVRIGNNCILWSGNHVGHRTSICDHNFISSHAVISGYCRIEEGSFMGVNSTVNDGITVAKSCVIGSGALISKDTEPERIYVGNPARAVPGKTSFESGI
jgi:sugar O-acyltransferase (sialic acid O-acetyltransferase NeuD family)